MSSYEQVIKKRKEALLAEKERVGKETVVQERLARERKVREDKKREQEAMDKRNLQSEEGGLSSYEKANKQHNQRKFQEWLASDRAYKIEEATRKALQTGEISTDELNELYNQSVEQWLPTIEDNPNRAITTSVDQTYNEETEKVEHRRRENYQPGSKEWFTQTYALNELMFQVGQENLSDWVDGYPEFEGGYGWDQFPDTDDNAEVQDEKHQIAYESYENAINDYHMKNGVAPSEEELKVIRGNIAAGKRYLSKDRGFSKNQVFGPKGAALIDEFNKDNDSFTKATNIEPTEDLINDDYFYGPSDTFVRTPDGKYIHENPKRSLTNEELDSMYGHKSPKIRELSASEVKEWKEGKWNIGRTLENLPLIGDSIKHKNIQRAERDATEATFNIQDRIEAKERKDRRDRAFEVIKGLNVDTKAKRELWNNYLDRQLPQDENPLFTVVAKYVGEERLNSALRDNSALAKGVMWFAGHKEELTWEERNAFYKDIQDADGDLVEGYGNTWEYWLPEAVLGILVDAPLLRGFGAAFNIGSKATAPIVRAMAERAQKLIPFISKGKNIPPAGARKIVSDSAKKVLQYSGGAGGAGAASFGGWRASHELFEQYITKGAYNTDYSLVMEEMGIGALEGYFLPLSAKLGQRVGGRMFAANKKGWANRASVLGTSYLAEVGYFGTFSPVVGEKIKTGEWGVPTLEGYAHTAALIGTLKATHAIPRGFKRIAERKFDLEITESERQELKKHRIDIDRGKVKEGYWYEYWKKNPTEAGRILKEKTISINLKDKILSVFGIRPNILRRITNAHVLPTNPETGKTPLALIGESGETIGTHEYSSRSKANNSREKVIKATQGGKELEILENAEIDMYGNIHFAESKDRTLNKKIHTPKDEVIASSGALTEIYSQIQNLPSTPSPGLTTSLKSINRQIDELKADIVEGEVYNPESGNIEPITPEQAKPLLKKANEMKAEIEAKSSEPLVEENLKDIKYEVDIDRSKIDKLLEKHKDIDSLEKISTKSSDNLFKFEDEMREKYNLKEIDKDGFHTEELISDTDSLLPYKGDWVMDNYSVSDTARRTLNNKELKKLEALVNRHNELDAAGYEIQWKNQEKVEPDTQVQEIDRGWTSERIEEFLSSESEGATQSQSQMLNDIGAAVPFSEVRTLAKNLGIKPSDLPGRSKMDYMNAIEKKLKFQPEEIVETEAEKIAVEDIKEKTKDKTDLDIDIDKTVEDIGNLKSLIETKWGKDWSQNKDLERTLNEKYDVDTVEELTEWDRRDFESDLEVEEISKTLDVGFLGLTPDNLKLLNNSLIKTGRFTFQTLPKHVQKIANNAGINKENFKKEWEDFSNNPKGKAKDIFKKIFGHIKNWWKKGKEFVREWIKNPKLGMSVQMVGKDGKPLTMEQQTAQMKAWNEKQMKVEREKREVSKKVPLSKAEKVVASKSKVPTREAEVAIRKAKAKFPISKGWAKIEVNKVGYDKNGNAEVTFKQIKGTFHLSKRIGTTGNFIALSRGSKEYNKQVEKMANKTVQTMMEIYERAKAGDNNAKTILRATQWYDNLKAVSKIQYGSYLNVFADLLGATSPNTDVRQNFRYTQEALTKMSRGDFDVILEKFERHVAEEGKSPSKFLEKHGFEQIKKLNGKLFGMNSNNASLALIDLWRNIKPKQAPKARNFSLNILGEGMPTIDVWAARFLQRMSGGKRIPPSADGGVSGEWDAKAENVTGQFGLGADVYDLAAEQLRDSGIPIFKDSSGINMQASTWFAEKELWTKNNWTTKAGEGGSFEAELSENQVNRYLSSIEPKSEKRLDTRDRKVFRDLNKSVFNDNDVIAHKAFSTYEKDADGSIRPSYDIEMLSKKFKPEYIKKVISLAEQEGNSRAIVSEVIQYENSELLTQAEQRKLLNARPGAEVWFGNKVDYAKALKIIEGLKNFDGIKFSVEPRARFADGLDGQYIGARFQIIPELALEKNPKLLAEFEKDPSNIYKWMDKEEARIAKTVDKMMRDGIVSDYDIFQYNTTIIPKEKFNEFTGKENSEIEKEITSGLTVAERVGEAIKSFKIKQGKEIVQFEGSDKYVEDVVKIGGLEAGFLGFTPQNFALVKEALMDTGHFLYEDLPKYVLSAGKKLGVTKDNFEKKYNQWRQDPNSFGAKTREFFKRVWAQMKNWAKKNWDKLRQDPTFRRVSDDLYKKAERFTTKKAVQESELTPEQQEILNQQTKDKARTKQLAKIKMAENSLLGKEVTVGGKTYKDAPIVSKKDLNLLKKQIFSAMVDPKNPKRKTVNLSQLYKLSKEGNPMADILMREYATALSRYQTRKRALDIVTLNPPKTVTPLVMGEKATAKEDLIDTQIKSQRRKVKDHRKHEYKNKELEKIADENASLVPRGYFRGEKQSDSWIKQKLDKRRKNIRDLNSTEHALELYQRETGLPIYDRWIDFRNAMGQKGLWTDKLLEPFNKALKETGYSNPKDIPKETGLRIHRFGTGDTSVNLSPNEMKIFEAIQEVYNNPDYQRVIKVNRFLQWYNQKNFTTSDIPGVSLDNLELLVEAYEGGGNKELFKVIDGVEGFIRENYMPQFYEIQTVENLRNINRVGIGKGGLKPQESDIDAIIQDPLMNADAIKNFLSKVHSDGNILFLDDIQNDMMRLSNATNSQALSTDINNILRSTIRSYEDDVFSSWTQTVVGNIMRAGLSMPTKWARNWFQRFLAVPQLSLQDAPKIIAQITKESIRKGGLVSSKSSSWLKADEDLKNFFLSNTASDKSIADEYVQSAHTPWLDALDRQPFVGRLKIGEGFKKWMDVYKHVDNSSRWADFNTVYNHTKPLLDAVASGSKKFSEIQGRIGFNNLLPEMKNIVLAEIDAGNTKYASMLISDDITARRAQFRYQKFERALIEQTSEGKKWMYALNYPFSLTRNLYGNSKLMYQGGKNYGKSDNASRMFWSGFTGAVGTVTSFYVFEELLKTMFGEDEGFGYGYNVQYMFGMEPGGLLRASLDTIDGLQGIGSSTIEALTSGNQKDFNKAMSRIAKLGDRLTQQQVLGVKMLARISEAVFGKDYKTVEPIRMMLSDYTKYGWNDAREVDMDLFKFFQKVVGGTGMSKEEAEQYKILKKKRKWAERSIFRGPQTNRGRDTRKRKSTNPFLPSD